MRTRILVGLVFLSALMFSAIAFAQSDMDEQMDSVAPPKLGISEETISVERNGDVLTLYWSGWIDLVKPSAQPISVSVRCALEPAGKWRTRPHNLVLPDTFVQGVNSSFHKFDLAEVDVVSETGGASLPPIRSLFDKDQVLSMKVSIRQQRTSQAGPSLAEHEYRLKPLGYLLLNAAAAGDLPEVHALLDAGARADSANLQGWDALMASCQAGHADVARLLIERQANLMSQTRGQAFSESANGSPVPRGATPLLVASYAGRPGIVKILLDAGATYGDYVRRLKRQGATETEIFDLLADTGSKRQQIIDNLSTRGADKKDIDALLNRGGFADIVWRMSSRGMLYAGMVERLKQAGLTDEAIAGRLRKEGAGTEDIRRAIEGRWPNNEALRQAVLDKGATTDEADTLLNERNASDEAVRTCLKGRGAKDAEIDPLIRDRGRGDEAIRAFLKEKGGSEDEIKDCLTEKGALAEDVVRFLVRHGGSVDAMRGDRWTPLMAASFSGNPQVVRLLLDEGANPMVTDESGYSPLALAYINGNSAAYGALKSCKGKIRVPWQVSED
jgi:ankyrin repeat protein